MARHRQNHTGSHADDVIDGRAIEVGSSGPVPVARPAGPVAKAVPGAVVAKRAAAATVGGLAAGAASVALARLAREAVRPIPGLSRRRKRDIESSQSILIDIHVLKPRR
jgi:hypothetical protein